jgi:hypothetical protein
MKNEPDQPPVAPCQPGVKKNFLFTLLLMVLGCAALLSLGAGVRRALQSGGSQDFQYSPSRVLLDGKNPYTAWLNGEKDRFLLTQHPNYLPNMLYLLSPFACLDWPKARFLWMMANMGMAFYFAWLLYAAQEDRRNQGSGLLIALLFLSSNPVRNNIGNGQQSLLILLATAWALRLRSKPFLAGIVWSVPLAKYSFGAFFIAAELGCRRILATVVAGAIVLAGFAGLCLQTHGSFNLKLLLAPLEVAKTGEAFINHFLWLDEHFGYLGVKLLPLIGLAVVLWRARALASASLPSDELAMKLACGATFASLFCAPHLGYDYMMLALPLALGCRLEQLKKFERYLYMAVLLYYWNLSGFLSGLQRPMLTIATNALLIPAFAALIYSFLAKASNRIDAASESVGQPVI